MISSSQTPLPDNTKHWQQTDFYALGGIRTHNLSRRAAADLRLRLRGHWDRQRNTNYNTVFNYGQAYKTSFVQRKLPGAQRFRVWKAGVNAILGWPWVELCNPFTTDICCSRVVLLYQKLSFFFLTADFYFIWLFFTFFFICTAFSQGYEHVYPSLSLVR